VFAHSGKHGETLVGNNVFATMFPSETFDVSLCFSPGMFPAWSGRGGGGGGVLCQLWCRVVSVINLLHYCKVLLDYSFWIVIVVHSSLIIMLLLKLLYLILSLIIFCSIMKNSTPLHPLWPGLGVCAPPVFFETPCIYQYCFTKIPCRQCSVILCTFILHGVF
jgi:hypothetical protein